MRSFLRFFLAYFFPSSLLFFLFIFDMLIFDFLSFMQKNKLPSAWYAAFSIALITLVGAGCTTSGNVEVSTKTSNEGAADVASNAGTSENTGTPATNSDSTPTTKDESGYADGTYSATGTYTSPGGKEELPVTLTLENGVIIEVSIETPATNPASKRWQMVFSENFKPLVVGKSLADVQLDAVSGSSLTTKGFNDAISQIKAQANS